MGYHPWPAAIRQGQEDDDPVLHLQCHRLNTAEGQAADERDDRARAARAVRLAEARGLLLAQDVLAMSPQSLEEAWSRLRPAPEPDLAVARGELAAAFGYHRQQPLGEETQRDTVATEASSSSSGGTGGRAQLDTTLNWARVVRWAIGPQQVPDACSTTLPLSVLEWELEDAIDDSSSEAATVGSGFD